MRYLENWDSFARETLYVSGSGIAQSNEMQLVAYEAGRAMSSLSWGITTTTVPLEDAASPIEDSETLLKGAWLNVFDEPTISSIQHQISALSTAMDGAYYRVHTDIPHPNGNTTQVSTKSRSTKPGHSGNIIQPGLLEACSEKDLRRG